MTPNQYITYHLTYYGHGRTARTTSGKLGGEATEGGAAREKRRVSREVETVLEKIGAKRSKKHEVGYMSRRMAAWVGD